MGNKRNNPAKNRLLRKHVREEKQRLRRRNKSHKKKKWVIVNLTIEDVQLLMKLREYAKKHHISTNVAVHRLVKKFMEQEAVPNA